MGNPGYVVTGANSGIGKAIAQGLAERGLRVIMLCRNPEKGNHALDDIQKATNNASLELIVGDLSSESRVRSAAVRLLERVSDIRILINNAGIWPARLEHNEDGVEIAFAVNHLAPFLLSQLLLDALKKNAGGRIVNVGASLYTIGKLDLENSAAGGRFSPFQTYADTKLCNVLFTTEFARRCKGNGVTINSVHPGVIRSNLIRNLSGFTGFFLRMGVKLGQSPVKGAEGPIYLSTSNEVCGVTGCFYNGRKQAQYAKNALDDAIASQLWELSEELTGLR